MTTSGFVKYHGSAVLEDRWRLEALSQVCDRVDGVITARVLSVDARRQEIVYERLSLETSLGLMVGRPEMFGKVGALLARMHMAEFSVDGAGFSKESCPMGLLGIDQATEKFLSEAIPAGWFHGDFWHGNVFILDDQRVAVIDPIPADFMMSPQYIRACGALDVAMMYMSILVVHPLSKQLTLNVAPQITGAEAFLEGYLRCRGMYTSDLVHSLRRASCVLSRQWMRRSSGRLAWPVYLLKSWAMSGLVSRVGKVTAWNKK